MKSLLAFPFEPNDALVHDVGEGAFKIRAAESWGARHSASMLISRLYGQRGYLGHPSLRRYEQFRILEPELVFDPKGHKVEVTYRLQQGIQRYIREVLFSGSEFTRDRVLRREVDVKPGEVADADEINRSLNRIFGTNYFSDEMSQGDHREPTYRFVTMQTDPKWVDLVKTGTFKELAPYDPDWYFVRAGKSSPSTKVFIPT